MTCSEEAYEPGFTEAAFDKFIEVTDAYNSGKTTQFSTDTTHANPIGFVSLDALDTFLSAAPTKDFAIMYRAGKTQAPNCIEVDYNSLEIVKSEPTKVYRKQYSINLPTGEAGKTYTVNLVKRNAT
jgi:hypothetical protein